MVAFSSGGTLAAAALNTAFNSLSLNVQTGTSYSLVLSDAGGMVTTSNASAVTLTIPTNASQAFPTGTALALLNLGAGLLTVAGASGVTVNPSSLSLAQYDSGTLLKIATNSWVLMRGGLPKAVVSSSTAASVTNVTVSGQAAKVYRFTGTGSITLSNAGLVDVLAIGPGGCGSYGSGGAGGYVLRTNVYVPSGSNLVFIGAGGTYTLQQGGPESSTFAGVTATGGGTGAQYSDRMPSGGACGGGSGPFASASTGQGQYFMGNVAVSAGVTRGGNGGGVNGGGGGGVGGDASGSTGGAGTSTDFSGTTTTYGAGGGGATMTANTGNGGNLNTNGNSGLILIRVRD